MSLRIRVIALVFGGVLAVAVPAQAASSIYAGDIVGSKTGKVALAVTVKHGAAAKITRMSGSGIPTNCEISGTIGIWFDKAQKVAVDPDSGRFKASYVQPTYGNRSTLTGRFIGDQVVGMVRVNLHYPADDLYPEESCDTGKLPFTAALGAPDEVVPNPRLLH